MGGLGDAGAVAAPIVVEAERIDGVFGRAGSGDGDAVGIRIMVGDVVLTAARARWYDGTWTLEDGTWRDSRRQQVAFGRATMILHAGAEGGSPPSRSSLEDNRRGRGPSRAEPGAASSLGVVDPAGLHGPGPLFGTDGVVFEEAAFVPCTCDDGRPGNVRIRATTATLEVEAPGGDVRAIVVRDAVVEVRNLRILRLPRARVPLNDEGFRWGLPQVGRGDAGWRVAVPLTWSQATTPGQARIPSTTTLAPRWRDARGFGLMLAHVGSGGDLRADAGWDALVGAPRGVLDATGHADAPTGSLAWDLDAASDRDWARDMGVGWSARTVPWRESRARVAAQDLAADAWLPDDGSAGSLLRVEAGRAWRSPYGARSPVAWSVRPGVEAGVDALETVPRAPVVQLPTASSPRALGSLSARGAVATDRWTGDLSLGTQAGRWRVTDDGGAWAAAAAGHARLAVPLWADVPGANPLVLEPGLDARGIGEFSRASSSAVASVGPALRARIDGPRGGARVDARLGLAGALDPGVHGSVVLGAARAELRSDGLGDQVTARWEGARGGLDVAAARLVAPDDAGGGVAEGGGPPSAPFLPSSYDVPRSWMRESVLAGATEGWAPRVGSPNVLVLGASTRWTVVPTVRVDVAWMDIRPASDAGSVTTVLSGSVAYDDGCTRLGVRGSGALDGTGMDLAVELRVR